MTRKKKQDVVTQGKLTIVTLIIVAIASIPTIIGTMTILFNTPTFQSEGGFDIFFIPFALSVIGLPLGIANLIYGIKNYKKLTTQHKLLIAMISLFTLLVAYWWFTIVFTLFMI